MRDDDRPDRIIDMLRAWIRFVIVSWKKKPHSTVCDICGFSESHIAGPVCPECGLYGLKYRQWPDKLINQLEEADQEAMTRYGDIDENL